MDQYRPEGRVLKLPEKYKDISRSTNRIEYEEALRIAREEGLHRFDVRWMH
jgi:putative pyruvate formate lyase activating enzyme